MIITGNQLLFKYLTLIFLLINTVAKSQNTQNIKVLFNTNYSKISENFALDTKNRQNFGFEFFYAKDKSKNYFISYGVGLNSSSYTKLNLPDNRYVVDNNGKINDDALKYYNANIHYYYITATIQFNYKLISSLKYHIGLASGIDFKYYTIQKTKYKFYDYTKETEIPISDIYETNIGIVNPSISLNVWSKYVLIKNLFLETQIGYSYDINMSNIPKFHKFGLSFGISKNF